MDLVSIVVPVYNAKEFIGPCIESLKAQSYQNIEILLVDDGSTDGSGQICDQYQREDERIQVFHRINSGVSETRNYGIQNARGKYILFVDADDTIMPDTVSENYKMAEENQLDLIVYCFQYLLVDEHRRKDNNVAEDYIGSAEDFFHRYFDVLLKQELINPPWNKFIRKSVIDEHEIRFNPNYSICEDMAFSAEVLAASKRTAINHNMYYNYCLKSNGTLVFKFHENYFEALSNFYEKTLSYCKMFQKNEEEIRELDSLYAALTIMFIKQICCKRDWGKNQKLGRIKQILQDDVFMAALKNARLNRKKEVVRQLIVRKAYNLIYLMYYSQQLFSGRKVSKVEVS